MKNPVKQQVNVSSSALVLSLSENASRIDQPLQYRNNYQSTNKSQVRESMNNHRRDLEQLEKEIQAELNKDQTTTQSTRPILAHSLHKYQQGGKGTPIERKVGFQKRQSQIEEQMELQQQYQIKKSQNEPLMKSLMSSQSLGGILLHKLDQDSIQANRIKPFLPPISAADITQEYAKIRRFPEPIRASINYTSTTIENQQPRQQSLPYISADRLNTRSLSSSGLSEDSSNGISYLKSSSILKNKAKMINEANFQLPQQSNNHRNSNMSHNDQLSESSSISPFKGKSYAKIPSEDTFSFDQINIQTEKSLIQKYLEFINSENDLYYLQGNFPNLFKNDLDQQQNVQGAVLNGALAICYDKGYSDSCSSESLRKLLPNFHIQLKKIASNPMISAGLASNQLSKRSDQQTFSENASNFGLSNAHIDDTVSVNQAKSTNSYSSKSSFFSRNAPSTIRQVSFNQLFDELKVIGNIPISSSGEVVAHQKTFTYNISLLTKFKVNIDLGFVQVAINTLNPQEPSSYNACTIHRLYISRIYRKLGHSRMIYLKTYHFLFSTFVNLQKLSIFISNKSSTLLKFQYSIGFRFDTVSKDSEDEKNRPTRIKLLLKRSEFNQIYNEFINKTNNG